MLPLPPVEPTLGHRVRVRLGRDYFVRIAGSEYSVDPVMIGRMVAVVASLDEVRITGDGRQGGFHARSWSSATTVIHADHIAAAARLSVTSNSLDHASRTQSVATSPHVRADRPNCVPRVRRQHRRLGRLMALQLTRTRTSRSPITRLRGRRHGSAKRPPASPTKPAKRAGSTSSISPRYSTAKSPVLPACVIARYEQVSLTFTDNLPFARSGRRVRRRKPSTAMIGRIVHLADVHNPNYDQSSSTSGGRSLCRRA